MALRSTSRNAVVVLIAFCAGCGAPIYLHDAGFESRVKDARSKWLQRGNDPFATMQSNLAQADKLERAAKIRATADQLTAIEGSLPADTWGEVRNTARDVRIDSAGKLAGLQKGITDTATYIAALEESVRNDPGAAVPGDPPDAPSSAGPVAAAADAMTAEAGKFAREDAPANARSLSNSIGNFLNEAEALVEKADKNIPPELSKFVDDPGVQTVLDVLRKANDQGLSQFLIDNGKVTDDQVLPAEIKDTLSGIGFPNIKTFGDLRALLKTKESAIAEIRLSLAKESRRTIAELHAAQLDSAKKLLRLYNFRALVLSQLVLGARTVETQIDKQGLKSDAHILATLENEFLTYRDAVAAAGPLAGAPPAPQPGLGAATRPAAAAPAADDGGERRAASRRSLTETLRILMAYTSIVGSLERWDLLTDQEILTLQHGASIEQARIATVAYGRLVSLGLDGVVTFSEGGITEQDIANLLRALQTVGIGVISGKVH